LGEIPILLVLERARQGLRFAEDYFHDLSSEVRQVERLADNAMHDAHKQGKHPDDITVADVRQLRTTTEELVWDPYWAGRLGFLCTVLNELRCLMWSVKPPEKLYRPGIQF
jgi:hypothetical protein